MPSIGKLFLMNMPSRSEAILSSYRGQADLHLTDLLPSVKGAAAKQARQFPQMNVTQISILAGEKVLTELLIPLVLTQAKQPLPAIETYSVNLKQPLLPIWKVLAKLQKGESDKQRAFLMSNQVGSWLKLLFSIPEDIEVSIPHFGFFPFRVECSKGGSNFLLTMDSIGLTHVELSRQGSKTDILQAIRPEKYLSTTKRGLPQQPPAKLR